MVSKLTPDQVDDLYARRRQRLLLIDPTDYQLEIERLEAELDEAISLVREALVEERNAQRLLALSQQQEKLADLRRLRIQDLVTKDAATETDFETAVLEFLNAKNGRVQIENALKMTKPKLTKYVATISIAKAKLAKAKVELQRTEVFSPVNGRIAETYVEDNMYVTRGQKLFKIVDGSAVEVQCSLRLDELAWVLQDQTEVGEDPTTLLDLSVAKSQGASPPMSRCRSCPTKNELARGKKQGSLPLLPTGEVGDEEIELNDATYAKFLGLPPRASLKRNLARVEPGQAKTQSGHQRSTFGPRDLPSVKVEIVHSQEGQKRTWNGYLRGFDGAALNPKTRTAPCRIRVPEPTAVAFHATSEHTKAPGKFSGTRELLPGMFVSVRVYVRPQAPLIRLSEKVIRPGNYVWRIVDDKLDVVEVKVVQIMDGNVLVLAEPGGLRPGDRIITTQLSTSSRYGVGATIEGMPVKEVNGK
ncbi:MAG: efflux RND transporter periplasmic adaptor subunit [Gemmataceae bacterium]